MTIGTDRVRVSFNPSADSVVDQIKQKTAELIDLCDMMYPAGLGERSRLAALAQTAYEGSRDVGGQGGHRAEVLAERRIV